MKKMMLLNLFLSIIILIILLTTFVEKFIVTEDSLFNKCDTIINHVRIDSIEYIIRSKDSIINNIKINTEHEIKKANVLDDDDAIKLFKQLVSE